MAHFSDNKLKRPLTGDERQQRADAVIGGSLKSFQDWMDTVVMTYGRIRDRIAEENGLGPNDLS